MRQLFRDRTAKSLAASFCPRTMRHVSAFPDAWFHVLYVGVYDCLNCRGQGEQKQTSRHEAELASMRSQLESERARAQQVSFDSLPYYLGLCKHVSLACRQAVKLESSPRVWIKPCALCLH